MQKLINFALKNYTGANYVTQLRARFLFFMFILIILFLPATMISTIYINLTNAEWGYRINLPVIMMDSVSLMIMLVLFVLLYKGYFTLAAHSFLIIAFIVVWTLLAIDRSSTLARLDTIAFLFALMSMMPLVITRHKQIALWYTLANIAALIMFLYFCGPTLSVEDAAVKEFGFDNLYAMILLGIVAYQTFSINKAALDQATAEIHSRREAEALYRQVVTSISSVIFKADIDNRGELTNAYISPAIDTILGLPAGTIASDLDRYFSYAHPDDLPRVKQNMMISINEPGHKISDEYRLVHANGDMRWMASISACVRNEDGRLQFFAISDDITERKQTELERGTLEEQLRQAQKMESIGRLAGGIAHDFNNLLTVIFGNIQLAFIDLDRNILPHKRLQEAGKAAESAAALTRQLLAFSRKQIIEPKILDLNQVIEHMSKMLVRVIGEDIELQTYARAAGQIKADIGQIEQIIVNLAVNARDAMPTGGALTIETADVTLDEFYCQQHANATPGPYVLLAISDTGEGMDEEVQRHLFEPFFTTKPQGKGTGLGLATIYGAVMQNGGSIQVYSAPGKGTAFKIYFPRIAGEAAWIPHLETSSNDLPPGAEKILLVEDEPQVRDFTQNILTQLGYTVIACASAEKALSLTAEELQTFPLLLTDVVLPGMNGRNLATEITARHPGIKVLFTSGYTENAIVHHAVLEQGIHFVGKPYTAGALARKVREVLDM